MRRRLLALCGMCLLLSRGSDGAASERAAAAEGRGLWAHLSLIDPDPAKGRRDIEALADRMAAAHMNLLLPWVRSEYVAALRDKDFPKDNVFYKLAQWNALGELIRAAAKREIKIHLWYSFTYYKSRLSYEMRHHPEWAAHRLDEFEPDKRTGKTHPAWMTDVCNMHPGARRMELDIVKFLLDRYPLVSGVHIEEPGFGYAGNCFCDLCNRTFKLIYGFDQKEAPDGPEATDLKCLATTDFMRRLRAMMLARNPALMLSANGGYRWQSDRLRGRDWERWSKLGWLDYYAAQIYVTDLDLLRTRAQETIRALKPDTRVFVGFNISPRSIRPKRFSPEFLVQAVEAARSAGADGVVFFWASVFTDEMARALGRGPFALPARLPRPPRLARNEQAELAAQAIRICRVAGLPKRWKFALDPRDEGVKQRWFDPAFDDSAWRTILIGRTWESQGYDYDGYAWYRTTMEAPDEAERCGLHFGAVDGRCWVYVNGRLVGRHAGWDEAFDVDASRAWRPGRNTIAVRVFDGSGDGGVYKDAFVFRLPRNLATNPGFEAGLKGWTASPHASAAEQDAAESRRCLRLDASSGTDAKAGFSVSFAKPVPAIVRLSFAGKPLGVRPGARVGVTVQFVFADDNWVWFMTPWELRRADVGRWTRKSAYYKPAKPLKRIGVYCINYRNDQPAFFDDFRLEVFQGAGERPAGDGR